MRRWDASATFSVTAATSRAFDPGGLDRMHLAEAPASMEA
jgi:hypothetical protein